MSATHTATITPSTADWVQFSQLANKRSGLNAPLPHWLTLTIMVTLGAGFAVAPWVLNLAIGRRADPTSFFVGVTMGVLALYAVIGFAMYRQRKALASFVKPDGFVLGKRTVTLNAEGIATDGHLGTGWIPWVNLDGVSIDGELGVLWLDRAAGYMIPARDFPSRAAFEAFMAFADERGQSARRIVAH